MTRAARKIYGRHQRADLREAGATWCWRRPLRTAMFPARPDLDAPAPVPVVGGREDDGVGGTQRDGDDNETPPPALDLAAVTGGDAFLVVETTPPGAVGAGGQRQGGRDPVGTPRPALRHLCTVTLDHPTHETVVLEDQTLAGQAGAEH